MTGDVVGPVTPDCERIAVDVLEVVAARPEQQSGASYAAACGLIGVVCGSVDTETGAIVLTHGMHRFGTANRPAIVLVVLLTHRFGLGAIPGIWVGIDDALGGFVGLGKEEPVPPASREMGVHAGQSCPDRHRIHDHQFPHTIGEVESESMGDVGAAVVASDGVRVVADLAHQRSDAGGHGPFRVGRVIQRCGWASRLTVPRQVRANHGELLG